MQVNRKEILENTENIKDERGEHVDNFIYLGVHLNKKGYIDEEVTWRIGAAGRIFCLLLWGLWINETGTKSTKMVSSYALEHPNFLPSSRNTRAEFNPWRSLNITKRKESSDETGSETQQNDLASKFKQVENIRK